MTVAGIASLRRRPLLFEAFPDLEGSIPWMPLAHVPTPVEPCIAARRWLGGSSEVFMKRDDLISPLYGGNKVRRYEFVLADAKARGARRIVTIGGLASTQAMATALFGRELGFSVVVVLFDQPVTRFARSSVRGFLGAGAELRYGGGYVTTIYRAWQAMRSPEPSYLILPGAANPLANLGYVDAMLELAAQVERGEARRPDVIVLPTGSSGTLAALALGAAWLGWKTEIVGVRITTPLACNHLTVSTIVGFTDRFLATRARRWTPQRDRARFTLFGGALGEGYGHPTAEAIEGAAQIEALTGAPGEVTYSGKAMAGLRTLLREPRLRGKVVLLWNTLSTPRAPVNPNEPIPPSLQWMFEGKTVG